MPFTKQKSPLICIIGNGWWGQGLRKILSQHLYNVVVYTSKSHLDSLKQQKCDLVFECTGDPDVALRVADICLENKKDLMTVNSEFDSHYGTMYNALFKLRGVTYSQCYGDQPGTAYKLVSEIGIMGFDPVVVGSCKKFLDEHQDPDGITPWIKDGQNIEKVVSFADGTKLNIEAAVMCNMLDMYPDIRGMHGMNFTKDELIEGFPRVISNPPAVDYTMGVSGMNQEAGVFVVAKLKQKNTKFVNDLEYLKIGPGPYYLFFRDYHLCYFEAAESVIKFVELGIPGMQNKHFNADVITYAKRDMGKGEILDGIGSYDVYGKVDTSINVVEGAYLPIACCRGKQLKYSVSRDSPITREMVCK